MRTERWEASADSSLRHLRLNADVIYMALSSLLGPNTSASHEKKNDATAKVSACLASSLRKHPPSICGEFPFATTKYLHLLLSSSRQKSHSLKVSQKSPFFSFLHTAPAILNHPRDRQTAKF
ncbi:hypothetical protein AVEN_135824-1 [Araneus ventricosus]|uniref:Uncharacterized protein n=1 Tax=Araneus ventricosus TaxID=182803 RepID=A0A4Y2KC12_ARAVE|nr:hypothetical protein AVEN_135824-1 [Araneus ventricosus]